MVDYREILRLKSLRYSNADISKSVHSSPNTVQEDLDISEELQIKWPLDDDVSNHDFQTILYSGRNKKAEKRMLPDFPIIHREIAKTGVTLTLLWTEYCSEAHAAGKGSYMSTQFGDLYRKWARLTKATMRITRKPGDMMEVDWPSHYPNFAYSSPNSLYNSRLSFASLFISIRFNFSRFPVNIRKM